MEIRDFPNLQECRVFISDHEPSNSVQDIGVFLNYVIRGRFKSKADAWTCVQKLIDECPSAYVKLEAGKELPTIRKVLNI